MSLNISLPNEEELKPRIIVFGVGGAGSNAVDNMISLNLEGIEFWAANTDAQALNKTLTENRIRLGITSTKGLGAGSDPSVGKIAAEESANECMAALDNCNMVFITAGMGGGTGTGGAPVIAKLAKEKNILTVGVVTKPFHFEGARRMKVAEAGIEELEKHVDTLIIIPNQNLFRLANEKTTFADAFKMADNVLHSGVRGVTDLITMPGLINLDFADIHSVMNEKGKAMMGTGEAEGESRATKAAEAAISNPLLDHSSMKGAKGVLINITGGTDMTLFEVDEAANRIKEEVDEKANIIFGSAFDNNAEGKLRVSVVATGIDAKSSKVINDSVVNQSGTINFENTEQNQPADDKKDYKVDNPTDSIGDTPYVEQEISVDSEQELQVQDEQNGEQQEQNYSQPSVDPDNVKDMVSLESEENADESNSEEIIDTTSQEGENEKVTDLFNKVASSSSDDNTQKENEKDRQKTLDMKPDHIFEIPAFLRKKKK